MKISIITVSYNSADTIEDTIKSVINQNHQDLEYIIIDGGSTDNTLKVVEKYHDKVAKVISEPDSGIYDAMNKGIQMANGEVVGMLNSDDCFFSNDVVSTVDSIFLNENIRGCYGDIVYVGREITEKVVRFWKAGDYHPNKLSNGWIMPHPAFFVRKNVYDQYGLFNLDFKIASDYELMLRFLLKGVNISYVDKPLVRMREGGYSSKNLKRRVEGWKELKMAWRVNGRRPPLFFIPRRIFFKIGQYLFL